jgi:hypothetical protein
MAKITTEEHKNGLIMMYNDALSSSMPGGFKKVLFKEALRKLDAGVEPKKVEDWVVNLEKSWNKSL